jgi:hypothetical protein
LMASEMLSKMGAWWKTSSIIRRFKHAVNISKRLPIC